MAFLTQALTLDRDPDSRLSKSNASHTSLAAAAIRPCRRSALRLAWLGLLAATPGAMLFSTPAFGVDLARFGPLYAQWGVYMTDERPRGVRAEEVALELALEQGPLDRKLTALAAMASQTAEVIAELGPERYASLVAEQVFVGAPAHQHPSEGFASSEGFARTPRAADPPMAFNSYLGAATG